MVAMKKAGTKAMKAKKAMKSVKKAMKAMKAMKTKAMKAMKAMKKERATKRKTTKDELMMEYVDYILWQTAYGVRFVSWRV